MCGLTETQRLEGAYRREVAGDTGRERVEIWRMGQGAEPRAQCTGSDRDSGPRGGQCLLPWGAVSAWMAHVLLIGTQMPHELVGPCRRPFLESDSMGLGFTELSNISSLGLSPFL